MRFLTSDGVSLFYEVDGEGQALVMLNGIWGDTSLWTRQVECFSKKYCCVRMDHRGVGRSEKWIGKYSYDLHARDTFELINELSIDKCHILGVCHGGMVGTTFAMNYKNQIISLIMNGTLLLKSHRQKIVYAGWRDVMKTSGFEVLHRSTIVPTIMSDKYINHNSDHINDMVVATRNRIDPNAALCLIDALYEYGYSEDQIAEINVPSLIISCQDDLFSPAHHVEKIHKLWKNSSYYMIKDSGHFPQREAAGEYNELVMYYLARYDAI